MRDFADASGHPWTASVREETGEDYKGRFYLVMTSGEGYGSGDLVLDDVRWNSERTARRTLETMSVVELRRRLRSAVGRGEAVS